MTRYHQCLTIDHERIRQAGCGRENQVFTVSRAADGTFEFRASGDKCLTAADQRSTWVGMAACGNISAQKIELGPAPMLDGQPAYQLKTDTGRCLTVQGRDDSKDIAQAECETDNRDQHFVLDRQNS
ncbi:RICIN domain-containing protein [Streptomyces sp. NPDC096013]|uniref:RICIN domain-containing protein n=1 Tax=Streptomyces sp. NPDC096013 TaxID=3366069 RepID=UPI0037FEA2AE